MSGNRFRKPVKRRFGTFFCLLNVAKWAKDKKIIKKSIKSVAKWAKKW